MPPPNGKNSGHPQNPFIEWKKTVRLGFSPAVESAHDDIGGGSKYCSLRSQHHDPQRMDLEIFSLWFGRVASRDQRFVAAKYGFNLAVTVFQHDERCTSARVFSGSGAIGDVPDVFIKCINPGFYVCIGHADTSRSMAGFILGSCAGIYEDCFLRINCYYRVGWVNARDIRS